MQFLKLSERKSLPIKFHQKLINESLMVLLFGVNELATDTSKKVKIFHKYNHRSLDKNDGILAEFDDWAHAQVGKINSNDQE